MPKENFNGVIAGGITFKEKDSEKTNSNSKGLSIQNKYAYVVALLMQQNKNTVAPDLKLNSVEPSQVNYRNVINANLQNPMAGYLNQMYVQAEVKGLSLNYLIRQTKRCCKWHQIVILIILFLLVMEISLKRVSIVYR